MIRRPPNSPLFPHPTLFRSDALLVRRGVELHAAPRRRELHRVREEVQDDLLEPLAVGARGERRAARPVDEVDPLRAHLDRKSTRLNSSHANISYAVFCLKKK